MVDQQHSGNSGQLKPTDAAARGMELAMIPMKDVPPLAIKFLRHLARRVGMCGEVCITAFAVYAQCIEGLPCGDSLYAARPEDREWFAAEENRDP